MQGLDWLYAHGCRRPAFVEPQGGHMHRNERERREAYMRWMEEKGLQPLWLYLPAHQEAEVFCRKLGEAADAPDALFFSSDYLAFSLLPLLAERRQGAAQGPRIIGFDNLGGRIPSPYAFSSIDIRSETRGREALRLLLRLIQEDGCPCCHVRIGTQLVVRGGKPLR